MASFTSTHPYTFQRPSTLATRSLVSDMTPATLPSASSNDGNSSSTSTGTQDQNATSAPAPTMAASSSNYAQATVGTGSDGHPTAHLERAQSWKLGDRKREATEQMLAGKGVGVGQQLHGYSSTGGL